MQKTVSTFAPNVAQSAGNAAVDRLENNSFILEVDFSSSQT